MVAAETSEMSRSEQNSSGSYVTTKPPFGGFVTARSFTRRLRYSALVYSNASLQRARLLRCSLSYSQETSVASVTPSTLTAASAVATSFVDSRLDHCNALCLALPDTKLKRLQQIRNALSLRRHPRNQTCTQHTRMYFILLTLSCNQFISARNCDAPIILLVMFVMLSTLNVMSQMIMI